jgi:ankyrin repeat protein
MVAAVAFLGDGRYPEEDCLAAVLPCPWRHTGKESEPRTAAVPERWQKDKGDDLMDIFEAARIGDAQTVEQLLASGADVNAPDDQGMTPLWVAAGNDRADIVRLLIERGADVNASGKRGRTPLHVAFHYGYAGIARLLIEKGADMNACKYGSTLLRAAYLGSADVVRLLIEKGADVNTRDKRGRTPLLMAEGKDHAGIARLLIEKGADVNARDKRGETPLHMEARKGHADVVRLLIEKGADVNARVAEGYHRGMTAMDLAQKERKNDVVRILEEALKLFSFEKLGDCTLLAIAKSLQMLPEFPSSEGYLPTGNAFDKYFSDAAWKVADKERDRATIMFSGVFDNNGRKALFSLELEVEDVQDPTMRPEKATINKTPLSEKELTDMLFAIFLETKK